MQSEQTMRAAIQHRYGAPEVARLSDVPLPEPGPGEVVVRVTAASIHPGDCFIMAGEPYAVRVAFGLRRPRRATPGTDLAGVVAAVGTGVTTLRRGEAVFGWSTHGTLAEYVRAPARTLVPVPSGLSPVEASAVPTSGMTALQALRDIANVRPGQTVLITGASGGVGTFAVQIAKALGAEVTGVCSARNADLVRSLGADHLVDYARTDFTETGRRYDVILDSVEARPLTAVRRALTPTGTVIPNSGRGGRWLGPLGRVVAARAASAFTRQRLRPFTSVGRAEDLRALADLISEGKVQPVVDRTYALEEASEALRHVAAGHTRGKVVVTV